MSGTWSRETRLGIFIVCPGWLFTGMPVTAGDVS